MANQNAFASIKPTELLLKTWNKTFFAVVLVLVGCINQKSKISPSVLVWVVDCLWIGKIKSASNSNFRDMAIVDYESVMRRFPECLQIALRKLKLNLFGHHSLQISFLQIEIRPHLECVNLPSWQSHFQCDWDTTNSQVLMQCHIFQICSEIAVIICSRVP
jgi:hypothetical protein